MDIDPLLEADDVRAVLFEFACEHQPGMSADEFLSSFALQGTIGAAVSQRVGHALGVKNTTNQSFSWPHGPALTCLSVLCASLAGGVVIEIVEHVERERTLRITGSVPSSPAHFGGVLTVDITEDAGGSEVAMRLVIPGQVFAWGAGKRLFKRIRARLDDATLQIEACPSVR